MTVDRNTLRQLLLAWQAGKLSPIEVRVRAEELDDELEERPATEEEYAQGNPAHISTRVVGKLDMMLWDLVTEEDIPFLLSFLDTPDEEAESAMKAWEAHFTPELYKRRKKDFLENGGEKSAYIVFQVKSVDRRGHG